MIDLRRWPLFIPLLAAVTGLALARTDMFQVFVAGMILVVLVVVLYLFRQRLPAVFLLLGALWGAGDLMLDANRVVVVDQAWLAETITVNARVEKGESLASSRRYLVQHIRRDDGVVLPGKALLYRYRAVQKSGQQLIQAGQTIRFQVRWRLPRNYQNPAAFDYRSWCFDRHIALIGSMRGAPVVLDVSLSWLEQQRQKIRAVLAGLSGSDHGILSALLLAERVQVSGLANRMFAATGTAHLLAISGMHIGMVAAWVFALVWFALTRREAWIVSVPVRNIALISGFWAAFAYGTMAGWPLPAMRATMMLGAAALAWCWSAHSEPINTLLAALALILLFDPSAIASLSLWLSFVATASLLLWAGQRHSEEVVAWPQYLLIAGRTLLWVSLLATLATLPLIVSTFGRIPLYTLPANMILVPLYAFFIMPMSVLGALFALFGLDTWAAGFLSLAGMAVDQGLQALSMLAALPGGELWAVRPSTALGLLYAAGMLAGGYLLWRKKRMQAAIVTMLVLGVYLFCALHESDVQQPQWIVWDVGQGAASTLLLPDNKVIVVDAPGYAGSRFNGGTTVAAGLRALGLSHIDVLVLSHAQADHLGGALSLLRSVNKIGEIWLPDVPDAHADKRIAEIESYAAKRGTVMRWMAAGDVESWRDSAGGSVSLQVLWPPRGHDPAKTNNTSLVLLAELNAEQRLLWPGDIEVAAERALLATGLQPVDMMLMPHHGSRSSSHRAFVQALQPDLVVAQTGVGNRYGFPSEVVKQRYQGIGARIYNTANGAVMLDLSSRHERGEPADHVLQWSANSSSRREMARAWWHAL